MKRTLSASFVTLLAATACNSYVNTGQPGTSNAQRAIQPLSAKKGSAVSPPSSGSAPQTRVDLSKLELPAISVTAQDASGNLNFVHRRVVFSGGKIAEDQAYFDQEGVPSKLPESFYSTQDYCAIEGAYSMADGAEFPKSVDIPAGSYALQAQLGLGTSGVGPSDPEGSDKVSVGFSEPFVTISPQPSDELTPPAPHVSLVVNGNVPAVLVLLDVQCSAQFTAPLPSGTSESGIINSAVGQPIASGPGSLARASSGADPSGLQVTGFACRVVEGSDFDAAVTVQVPLDDAQPVIQQLSNGGIALAARTVQATTLANGSVQQEISVSEAPVSSAGQATGKGQSSQVTETGDSPIPVALTEGDAKIACDPVLE